MELIYFISGILTVGVTYGIKLIRQFNSTHELLLRSNQHSTNISSARYGEMKEKIEEMNMHVGDIESQMKKDSYAGINKLSKQVDKISNKLNDLDKKVNMDIGVTERSFTKTNTEIQTLKNQMKKLGEDPNFLSRY